MTVSRNRIALGLAFVALVAVLGIAGFAAAQDRDHPRDHRPFMGRGGPGEPGGFVGRHGPGGPLAGLILRDIDLSDAQEEQIRAILEARRAADGPLMERAQTARQGLQSAIQTQPVDEAAIRARSAELAVVEADLAVSRARLHADIFSVLTPDQQAQVNERREEMQERRNEFRERHGR